MYWATKGVGGNSAREVDGSCALEPDTAPPELGGEGERVPQFTASVLDATASHVVRAFQVILRLIERAP
jgi:hypothetical protein